MIVIKRTGENVEFNVEKVLNAIFKTGKLTYEACKKTATLVENTIREKKSKKIEVEVIQDIVEQTLFNLGHFDALKSFILYRAEHQKMRDTNEKLNKELNEILNSSSKESNLKRDNANIDGDCPMGAMLQVASAASKDFYAKNYLTKEQFDAHTGGDIHIHDFDFYGLTTTCCQIDLIKLFDGGFSTGHGYLREPNSINSYAALAAISIQSNQNDQHGGQSIPNFDYAMALGVKKTFRKVFLNYLFETIEMEILKNTASSSSSYDKKEMELEYFNLLSKEGLNQEISLKSGEDVKLIYCTGGFIHNQIKKYLDENASLGLSMMNAINAVDSVKIIIGRSVKQTDKATHQAMEGFIHNLNTMHSRAGAQTPFSSINYGTDTSPEGRMIIKNILLATEEGLGNGETPIFPIQIFKIKEGVNFDEADPNYDLFKLSCRVSAKRLFPNFSFIDSPFNLQYYKKGCPETEVAYMGCRTRVMGNTFDKTKEISYGRGNLSFTSINLPRIAIKAETDIAAFSINLEKMLNVALSQLLNRFSIQARRKVLNFPFLMGQGVWHGSDTLRPTDDIVDVIKHGTLSIGFIGLAETLISLTGKHHGESEDSQELGLTIIQQMRDFCDKKSLELNLNITLMATPAEGLSGTFIKKDIALFGEISGINDKEYYTNSFHVPVSYQISACDKLRIEAPYHELTNAGHISYVELDGDTANNVEAFESIVRYMHDVGIGYGSINHPVDRDPVCGYIGVIGEECPRCGRKAGESISDELLQQLKKRYSDVPYYKEA